MIGTYLPLLVLLFIIAAAMHDDFALTLIYLFVGALGAGIWWSRRSLAQVQPEREFADRAFLGEKVRIVIKIRNLGWLPVPWLSIQDGLPVALSTSPSFQRVTSLGPKSDSTFAYTLEARKRGYYPIGPLSFSTGDILGLNDPLQKPGQVQYLTVYPKIVPLAAVKIPSRSPQGTLRHTQPLFEDPTRVFGKREYISGDSLRRVDWKSTATTGHLQVKMFEPSIALETLIFLNLNDTDYYYRRRIDSTELAIVIAASVASWIAEKQQTVGLKVNGIDPLMADGTPQYLPPRKGQSHLMRILETLARIEMTHESSLVPLIQRQRYHLPWGTTLIVITGEVGSDLLAELYQARRAGRDAVLIQAGTASFSADIQAQAELYGIPMVSIPNERGLDIWRK
jgi:uncharacterized protein (DUF58 family)